VQTVPITWTSAVTMTNDVSFATMPEPFSVDLRVCSRQDLLLLLLR